MAVRSARLEQVLGASLDRVTAAQVRDLVANEVPEAFDLDYKREMYGRTDADRRALAGDVAALANTAGGLIIIGIDEDAQARAGEATPVPLADDEVARIRQIVGSLISPVPTIDVYLLPDTGSAAEDDKAARTGFIMIAVGRSLAAPHAVLVNDALRYPRRNGATTRYLSEPEVAEAYRARLAGLGAQADRLDTVWRAGLERLDVRDAVWAAVALTPELPGEMRINQASHRAFQSAFQGRSPTIAGPDFPVGRTHVGLGFLHADGAEDHAAELATWVSLDLHTDGGGFFAMYVGRRRDETEQQAPVQADDELLTVAVLSALANLGEHASSVAAGGDALLRAGLWKPSEGMPVHLGHRRGFGGATYGASPRRTPLTPVETVAPLDALTPGPSLVATAARLCQQIGHAFGAAELGQLTEDGQIRRRYFSNGFPRLEKWADAAGVKTVDDTLPG